MTIEFSIGFDDDDDDLDIDEMQAYVIIEHLRAENNMLFDRAATRLAELKEAQARISELEQQRQIAVTALAICREQRDEAADANLIMARELTSTDNADRYYRGFNAGYDHAIRTMASKTEART